ncbi:hypothetical protein KIN20_009558 [Parelaphostrongylus tenuis]|uniref:Uncharacterized protein n=1 Tax=Parelaphostrongylus tenuis TaxID=148309 RepID=A0AAD5M9P6_PARTN|nr:hypothetical protein KIN20_009558 [Parelaphostrongylus tenuis]
MVFGYASGAVDLVFQMGIEVLTLVRLHHQCRVVSSASRPSVLLVLDELDVQLAVVLLVEALFQSDVWAPFVGIN